MKLKFKNHLMLIFMVLVTAILFYGCGNNVENKYSSKSEISLIKLGLPITTSESCCTSPVDKQQGFQTDLWYEIGNRIGYKIQFKSAKATEMESLMDSDEIQSAIINYTNESSGKEKYVFTNLISDSPLIQARKYPFKTNNTETVNKVNSAIEAMMKDGTLGDLIDQWFNNGNENK